MLLLVSLLPFLVCLIWLIVFLLKWKVAAVQLRFLSVFAGLCTILYGCHSLYFNNASTLLTESIWAFCSLASYPFYLLYLVSITSRKVFYWPRLLILLPAIAISLLRYIFDQPWVDFLRQATFLVALLFTCVYGLIILFKFERSIKDIYSDLALRSTRPIQHLLICFSLTSVLSAFFNIIGRHVFLHEALLLAVPSILFATMLFLLFYIGNKYDFSLVKMENELGKPDELPSDDLYNSDILGGRLNVLMVDHHLYLRHDLKLTDLAKEVGTCRTYLSSYLNNNLQISFSDYINRQRIDYAKDLLLKHPDLSTDEVAERSGFSSVSTYKRNLAKFS